MEPPWAGAVLAQCRRWLRRGLCLRLRQESEIAECSRQAAYLWVDLLVHLVEQAIVYLPVGWVRMKQLSPLNIAVEACQRFIIPCTTGCKHRCAKAVFSCVADMTTSLSSITDDRAPQPACCTAPACVVTSGRFDTLSQPGFDQSHFKCYSL